MMNDGVSSLDIDNHPASRVLPFLYLGNGKDAADPDRLRELGTTCVLNVTCSLPGAPLGAGITHKRIPASDSGQQNLKQYFEEAFEFIGESDCLTVYPLCWGIQDLETIFQEFASLVGRDNCKS